MLEGKRTIHAVAAAAGVSAATVSRVLNDRPGVKARTREAVLAAIERLGYTPDLTARELSSRQTVRVGLNDSYGNLRLTPFATLFREHLFRTLYQQGFSSEDVLSRPDGLPERVGDVMVLTGLLDDDPRVAYLLERGVPCVVLGRDVRTYSVASDDYGGGLAAARHLLRLGHRELLVVSGGSARLRTARFNTLGQAAFERQRGVADALGEAGLTLAPERVVCGDFTALGGFLAVSRALKDGLAFGGVVAFSDEMAEGAIAAAEEAGLRVPEDVSVVGFDDLPEIGETFTTIRQDVAAYAATTVELMREALGGNPLRHVTLPVQLVVRGTTSQRR